MGTKMPSAWCSADGITVSGTIPGSDPHGQALGSADDQVPAHLRLLDGHLQLRIALQQRTDRDLRLRSRQRRPQAEVNPVAESHVLVLLTPQVDTVRLLELRRVAVGRAH